MGDSLRRNSSFLIVSQAINAVAMFLFWAICARIFSANSVGLATAFISLATLVATFTQFGLSNTTIRFLATAKNKVAFFNAALVMVTIGSILGGLVVLFLIPSFSTKLEFINHSAGLTISLLVLVAIVSLGMVSDAALVSFRKGEHLAYKAGVASVVKIILPFALGSLMVAGIVYAYVLSLIMGVAYQLWALFKYCFNDRIKKPDVTAIWEKRNFTFGNYIGGAASILPTALLPLIVLGQLGAKSAAYLYMPMQLTGFLVIIASSTAQALFSEASRGEHTDNVKHLQGAFKHAYRLLIPSALLLIMVGWVALHIYGQDYASHGFLPLILLCVASLFIGVNTLGDTWLLVKKNMRGYISMQVLNAALVIAFVYLFIGHNLTGVGVGWLIGQVVTAIIYISIYAKTEAASLVKRALTK